MAKVLTVPLQDALGEISPDMLAREKAIEKQKEKFKKSIMPKSPYVSNTYLRRLPKTKRESNSGRKERP